MADITAEPTVSITVHLVNRVSHRYNQVPTAAVQDIERAVQQGTVLRMIGDRDMVHLYNCRQVTHVTVSKSGDR